MAMSIIMKEDVVSILSALAMSSADATLAVESVGSADFLRGYHAALRAVAAALGSSVDARATRCTVMVGGSHDIINRA